MRKIVSVSKILQTQRETREFFFSYPGFMKDFGFFHFFLNVVSVCVCVCKCCVEFFIFFEKPWN